jgi:hypothetical protein
MGQEHKASLYCFFLPEIHGPSPLVEYQLDTELVQPHIRSLFTTAAPLSRFRELAQGGETIAGG